MTRGKHKKNGSPFVNNFANESGGRGRRGKRGGSASIQIVDEDEALSDRSKFHSRGSRRGQLNQINYEKRYNHLVDSEPFNQPEVLNSMRFLPHTERKSRRSSGSVPYDEATPEPVADTGDSSRKQFLGTRKSQKGGRPRSQSYNRTIYNYMDTDATLKSPSLDKVHSEDMAETPDVVLPATEGWAEVVIDRRGNQESLSTSHSAVDGNTWGLGYVTDDRTMNRGQETSPETVSAQDFDGNSVQAVSEANPGQIAVACGEELSPPMEARMGILHSSTRKGAPGRNKRITDDQKRGFLSIGGLKVWTTDVSDMSDEEDSCMEQMEEGFADEDDGYIDWSRKFDRGKKRNKDIIAKKKQFASPDPRRSSAIVLDSSDGDESYVSSETAISDELVNDYLANCEGLSLDISNPSWVSRNLKALEQTPIDEMGKSEEDSESSEELDSDQESNDCSGSENELEDDLKIQYKITSSMVRAQAALKRGTEEATLECYSDVDVKDLEQKVFFGYESDSDRSGEDEKDALLSDDEARILELKLDEAHLSDLDFQKSNGDIASANEIPEVNRAPKYRAVGRFVCGPTEDVQLARSVATQIWPVNTGKISKKSKGIPGLKKRERQDTISTKRRERAVARGFDLVAVNKALEDMVRLKKDIIAFEPMEQRDRAQVLRLAHMYKLNSSTQGTTKRRFVVVSITSNTGMPSAEDKVRLLKILGQVRLDGAENPPRSSRSLTGEEQRKVTKMKRAARQALQGLDTQGRSSWSIGPLKEGRKGAKNRYFPSSGDKDTSHMKGRSTEKLRGKGKATTSGQSSHMKRSEKKASKTAVLYANKPVSFIGRGHEGDDACIISASVISASTSITMEGIERQSIKTEAVFSGAAGRESRHILKSSISEFAVFEAHTNGFASRMMAKMGYVEGQGLGRDKQGIAQPVEAVKRPKSLGLGAHS